MLRAHCAIMTRIAPNSLMEVGISGGSRPQLEGSLQLIPNFSHRYSFSPPPHLPPPPLAKKTVSPRPPLNTRRFLSCTERQMLSTQRRKACLGLTRGNAQIIVNKHNRWLLWKRECRMCPLSLGANKSLCSCAAFRVHKNI